MKFIERNKKLVIFLSIFTGLIIILFAGYFIISNLNAPSSTIIVQYTPQKATVYINGEKKSNENKVSPGEYTVKVSLDGFAPYEKKVSIKDEETITLYAILESNAYYTANWYKENPKDAELRERLTDRAYIARGKEIEKNFPIMKILPYVGPRGGFRVDYGIGTIPDSQAIYISLQ